MNTKILVYNFSITISLKVIRGRLFKLNTKKLVKFFSKFSNKLKTSVGNNAFRESINILYIFIIYISGVFCSNYFIVKQRKYAFAESTYNNKNIIIAFFIRKKTYKVYRNVILYLF